MPLRPNPFHLAVGSLAVGLSVFLLGVGSAWRSSDGGTGAARPTAAGADAPPSIDLDPGTEATPADVEAGAVAPSVDPTTIASLPPATGPPAPAPAQPAAAAVATAKEAMAGPGRTSRTAPFSGMGTWVDVFDWSPTYAKGQPVKLQPSAVDAMADQGVQALYIQTTRADYAGPGDIVDPSVLDRWLARARARGVKVVAWYLPTLTDVGADIRRLEATSRLPVAGIGVDIESRAVADPDARSARLVELSRSARTVLGDRPMSAITLPNVVTDVLNLNYWPRFPWAAIKPFYDVWQPMGYWTNRLSSSPYRNAELYTRENVDRLRAKLGDPNAVVHPIGGIGDKTTTADVDGFLKAVRATRAVGASLYDWSSQSTTSYGQMKAARA